MVSQEELTHSDSVAEAFDGAIFDAVEAEQKLAREEWLDAQSPTHGAELNEVLATNGDGFGEGDFDAVVGGRWCADAAAIPAIAHDEEFASHLDLQGWGEVAADLDAGAVE